MTTTRYHTVRQTVVTREAEAKRKRPNSAARRSMLDVYSDDSFTVLDIAAPKATADVLIALFKALTGEDPRIN